MAVIGFFSTLAEAQELVTDRLLAGIIEEGQLIPVLPVTQLDAKTLIYNREETLPDASFYDIGEDIPAQAQATTVPETATLKRCIGQWDLDNFIKDTYKDPNEIRGLAFSMAKKGVMRKVEDKLLYGNATTTPKEFDGLHALVTVSATASLNMALHAGLLTVGGALTLALLDELIDKVKPLPDMLLMNFEIYRRLQAVGRGILGQWPLTGVMARPGEDVGQVFPTYRGIPIVRTNYLVQTETITGTTGYALQTGGACTSVFAFRKGAVEEGGLTLVTGSPMFEVEEIVLEDKDANRFRVKWYVTMTNGSTRSLAVIDGITDAAVTA